MFSITKTFRVSCGHRLSKHPGLCKNFHGHNLRIQVTISSRSLNSDGMIMDFTELKGAVMEIIEDWDHCLFLNSDDKELIDFMREQGMRIILTHDDPTAERMCQDLHFALREKFQARSKPVHVKRVRIWENDDSMAEYEL
jgi:6-pyruvoyltetrahydropterin/6-carboxytetrahydropterin synthase